MKYVPIRPKRILSLDPTTEGLAFAVLEDGPLQLIDWGIKNCGRKKASALDVTEKLLERFRPDVLVMEDYEAGSSRRQRRTQRLIQHLIALAGRKNLRVRSISRQEVRGTLRVKTKNEVAATVARFFPELLPQLPRQREIYIGEDYRMAIFDAVALALTSLHFETK